MRFLYLSQRLAAKTSLATLPVTQAHQSLRCLRQQSLKSDDGCHQTLYTKTYWVP